MAKLIFGIYLTPKIYKTFYFNINRGIGGIWFYGFGYGLKLGKA